MIEFKYESPSDEEGIENLLDLVFSPTRINLSSYSLREEVPKIKTLCFVAKNTGGSIIGVIRNWPILIGERKNLSSGWVEFVFGVKTELILNFYLGISLRLNRILSQNQPENFGNLYVPGFNKVTDGNNFGAGFNYTLTYSFPFKFKK